MRSSPTLPGSTSDATGARGSSGIGRGTTGTGFCGTLMALLLFYGYGPRGLRSGSRPRPELHLERAREPVSDEPRHTPPAADDLGLPGRLGPEQQVAVVDERGDEHAPRH